MIADIQLQSGIQWRSIIKLREILEYGLKVIELLRPRFYNKITWLIVVSGLALMSTPLWERVLDAILKRELNVSISGENDAAWGFSLCALGLFYHLINSGIYDALSSRSKRERAAQEAEHDRSIFMEADNLLGEGQLDSIASMLGSDHSIKSDDSALIDRYCDFLSAAGNTFIQPNLRSHTQEFLQSLVKLRHFIGNNFDMYPYNQTSLNYRICMAPNLNCDRAGGYGSMVECKRPINPNLVA